MNEYLSQCGYCKEALNENCNMVAKNREGIGLIITHGICPACEEKHFPVEEYPETQDEPIPNTLRTGEPPES